jgi:pimeloyl-ACP methyl ester carboxylesterase
MSPTAPRSARFTTPSLAGVSLHALRRGPARAPRLVLLHGGGANAHWWDHIAGELADDFHVVALDFRGHGDSDYPDRVEEDAFARDLEALLEHLGAPEAILIGHSMGAHVALGAASRGPAPRAVVAIESSRGGKRGERRRARLALATRRTYATRAEAIRRFQFLPDAPEAAEELRGGIAAHSVREEGDGRFGFKFDPRWFGHGRGAPPAFDRIACPVLLIRGSDSSLLSSAGARELAAEIPDATLVEIPAAGHNVQIERPREVLDAMKAFLEPFSGPAAK